MLAEVKPIEEFWCLGTPVLEWLVTEQKILKSKDIYLSILLREFYCTLVSAIQLMTDTGAGRKGERE